MNFGFWKILELLGELSSLKMLEKPDYCLFFCVNGVPFARWKIIARDFTPMVSLYFLATELQHVWYATMFKFFGTVANQTTHQIVLCQNKRWRTLISVLKKRRFSLLHPHRRRMFAKYSGREQCIANTTMWSSVVSEYQSTVTKCLYNMI